MELASSHSCYKQAFKIRKVSDTGSYGKIRLLEQTTGKTSKTNTVKVKDGQTNLTICNVSVKGGQTNLTIYIYIYICVCVCAM